MTDTVWGVGMQQETIQNGRPLRANTLDVGEAGVEESGVMVLTSKQMDK